MRCRSSRTIASVCAALGRTTNLFPLHRTQERRGAVGQLSGTGYVKRYSYDRCAAVSPPPYFPTTGRLEDNRYLEIDLVRFDVGALFARLTPS